MTDSIIAFLATEESLIVPPQESSAVRAQRFVRRVLIDSDVESEAVDLAVLMTKALIINGLLHTRSAIAVSIKVLPESIRIEVADAKGPELHVVQDTTRSWGMATISR
jgi:hypothetical protein